LNLSTLADYRHAQGTRLPLQTILLCIFLAELAGKHSGRTKETWIIVHWLSICMILQTDETKRPPSDTTMNRVLKKVNSNLFQRCVSATMDFLLRSHLSELSIIHYALDGKSRKGVISKMTSRTEIDLTLFEINTSFVVGKITLPDKQGECTAAPALIRDLFSFPQKIPNGIITFDCAMTTPQITETIIETGNDYLGALKGFNGNVYTAIAEYDWGTVEVCEHHCELHHGRLEDRKMKILAIQSLPNYLKDEFLKYDDAAIVLQIERKRIDFSNKKDSYEIAYYVGSSGVLELNTQEIYELQKNHWLIENRNNYVRDVILKEDHCFTKENNASRNLGALRDFIVSIASYDGAGKIKNYLTHFASKFSEMLGGVRSLEIYQELEKFGVCRT
jgi:predicted transposase YbfD/YdcC